MLDALGAHTLTKVWRLSILFKLLSILSVHYFFRRGNDCHHTSEKAIEKEFEFKLRDLSVVKEAEYVQDAFDISLKLALDGDKDAWNEL